MRTLRVIGALILALFAIPFVGVAATFFPGPFHPGTANPNLDLNWLWIEQLDLDRSATFAIIHVSAGGAVAAGLILLAVTCFATKIGRNSPRRLSAAFKIVLPLSAPLLIAIMAADTVILIASLVALGNRVSAESFLSAVAAAIVVGAVRGTTSVLELYYKRRYHIEANVLGALIPRDPPTDLWRRVDDIAAALTTPAPDNVIVVLDTRFSVTSGPVRLPFVEQTLLGNTLFVSLGAMQVLSAAELDAVLCHELAHFVHQDTQFLLNVSPIYQNLSSALTLLNSRLGIGSLANFPARVLLSFVLQQFARAERGISRKRESEADRLAATIGGSENFVSSLTKLTVLNAAWAMTVRQAVEGLNNGAPCDATLPIFMTNAGLVLREAATGTFVQRMRNQPKSGGLQGHPTLNERAAAAGLPITPALLDFVVEDSQSFRGAFEEVDRMLTRELNSALISEGIAHPPRQKVNYVGKKRALMADRAAAQRRIYQNMKAENPDF
jgi:Zn-dependent protease with chaperone function